MGQWHAVDAELWMECESGCSRARGKELCPSAPLTLDIHESHTIAVQNIHLLAPKANWLTVCPRLSLRAAEAAASLARAAGSYTRVAAPG